MCVAGGICWGVCVSGGICTVSGWWYLLVGYRLMLGAGCTRTNLYELFACTVALKRAMPVKAVL